MPTVGLKKQFTAIDLFCGCGGLSLGLERAGFTIRAAVEVDPIAAETYKKNHPNTVLIHSDIRKVSPEEIQRAVNLDSRSLDLLAGCPPCQGFSRITSKNRPHRQDPRNDLIFDFLKLAKRLRPKTILMENVPGLQKNYRFDLMVQGLRSHGYNCAWAVLNAADFSVPQRRKRLILMASRLGPINVPNKNDGSLYKTVKDAIGKLEEPGTTKDVLHRMYLKNTPRIKKLISQIPVDGGSRKSLGDDHQLPCHKKIKGFWDVYGRMKWNDVAPTLTGSCFNPSRGRFLHPLHDRAITLREAALLQTFPKGYYFPVKSGLRQVARLIGDALPPVFARKQAKHLLKHLTSYI